MDPFTSPLRDLLGLRRTTGDVGFEVEVEYPSAALPQIVSSFVQESMSQENHAWNVSEDGSLRHGLELVSRRPVQMKHVPNHLSNLQAIINRTTERPIWSIRTSSHIHINVQNRSFSDIFRACTFFWLVEDYLIQSQGKARIGNLFCLRNSDARSLSLNFLRDFRALENYTRNDFRRMPSVASNARYSSLNLAALGKFGSLEFRFLRGMFDTEELSFWARLFYNLVQNSPEVDPKTVLRRPVEDWLPEVLGKEEFMIFHERFPDTSGIVKQVFQLSHLLAGRIDSEHWEKETPNHRNTFSHHEDIDFDPHPMEGIEQEDDDLNELDPEFLRVSEAAPPLTAGDIDRFQLRERLLRDSQTPVAPLTPIFNWNQVTFDVRDED